MRSLPKIKHSRKFSNLKYSIMRCNLFIYMASLCGIKGSVDPRFSLFFYIKACRFLKSFAHCVGLS